MTQQELRSGISKLVDSEQVQDLILRSSDYNKCHINQTVIQHKCFLDTESSICIPQCTTGMLNLMLNIVATKPDLIDDKVIDCLVAHFQKSPGKLTNLITYDTLNLLHNGKDDSQTKKWLKYEILIKRFINCGIYEPSTMLNEVLGVARKELDDDVARKFSSLISSCVDTCRKSKKISREEEEEQKWCEILDWMSWFLGSDDNELDF